jgi:hypothetical protein
LLFGKTTVYIFYKVKNVKFALPSPKAQVATKSEAYKKNKVFLKERRQASLFELKEEEAKKENVNFYKKLCLNVKKL